MVRKSLLASAALSALLGGATASFADPPAPPAPRPLTNMDDGGDLTPLYGKVNPFYGKVNPFYGTVDPFYGKVNPFYGKISPFWGDISPFWGKINPFYGKVNPFYGTINPFWGKINPFATPNGLYSSIGTYWQSAGPQWGSINTLWDSLQAANATDYSGLQAQLTAFLAGASAAWTPAMQKDLKKSDFNTFFANPLLAQYGIDPTNAASLGSVTGAQRSAFFLDFYDSLMNYSGQDHVDWWMAAVHWSPMLAQIQGSANNASVGILDAYATPQNADVSKLDFAGGYKNNALDHGAAVASLIAAKQDGTGVMGVAPNATIQVLYNPFDSTGTADWSDIANGINTLFARKASVINASLGVPGSVLTTEWSNILGSKALQDIKHQVVLVKAAGNEGVMQTDDVPWTGAAPTNLILVGSVDPTNTISNFSNTPGEACITTNGVCNEQDKLKYRFLVAPGELLLVQDNHGGVTRVSGTSFAAPLVTGAISLLQDRWPWLQQHADETVQIILQSATDLGAPGVDQVYGWGELNVEASQSPLNFNNLVVYQPTAYPNANKPGGPGPGGGPVGNFDPKAANGPILPAGAAWNTASLKQAVLTPGQLDLWQQQGAYVVAFETIGSTYRDFTIPLSSLLVNQNVGSNGANNPFQTYLYQRLIDWAGGTSSAGFAQQAVPLDGGDWRVSMLTTASTEDEVRTGAGPVHAEFAASNPQAGIDMLIGEGSGVHALTGGDAFALRSDFDPATGGVNPVLGLASGGMYASGGYAIGTDLKLSLGFSEKSDDHTVIDPTFGPLRTLPLADNRASASVATLAYTLTKGVTATASYTELDEANAVLGAQGGGILSMSNGARTQATTLGATAALGGQWTFGGSLTLAHTTAPQSNLSNLSLADGGLQSTAFEFVASKAGVFSDTDTMRLSLAQPLHVESGALTYTSIEVTDRSTGAVGPVGQSWNISGNREYRLEATYDLPLLEGRAHLNAFSLVDLNPPSMPDAQVSILAGAAFRIGL
jgi:hypothetical protein